jgi:hypothetical protein
VSGTTSAVYDNSKARSCQGNLIARHEPFQLKVVSAGTSSIGVIASPSPVATAASTCAQGLLAGRWKLTVSPTKPPYRSSSEARQQMWWLYNHPGGGFHGKNFTPLPKGGDSEGWQWGWGGAGSFKWLAVFSIHRTRQTVATPITFNASDGRKLDGETFGEGKVGIVVAHDADSNYLEWEPAARLLSGHGYRVLLFDYATNPFLSQGNTQYPAGTFRYDNDITGAVAYLKHTGSSTVVLAGDGIGGLSVIVAAQELGTQISRTFVLTAGGISGSTDTLGDPNNPDDLNALTAAPHLTTPLLLLAARSDTNAGPLYKAAASTDKRLIRLPNSALNLNNFGLAALTSTANWAKHARTAVLIFLPRP